jgi:LPS export ABC transporter protein LptC
MSPRRSGGDAGSFVLSVLLLTAVVPAAGCGGRSGPSSGASPGAAGAPSPSGSGSATPGHRGAPTPIPIKIHSKRIGSKYIYLTEQKRNRVVYVLRADSNTSIRLAEGAGHSEFERPHVIFYGSGKRSLVADSPLATVEERDKSVLMSGGVHTRTDRGMTLASDTLRYDDATERLLGEGHVVVTTPQGEELRGDHLDYDMRTTEMHVTAGP